MLFSVMLEVILETMSHKTMAPFLPLSSKDEETQLESEDSF